MNRIPPRVQGDMPDQGRYEDGTPHDDCTYVCSGCGQTSVGQPNHPDGICPVFEPWYGSDNDPGAPQYGDGE